MTLEAGSILNRYQLPVESFIFLECTLNMKKIFILFTSNKKIVNLGHQICFIFSYLEKVLRKETESWVQTLVGKWG